MATHPRLRARGTRPEIAIGEVSRALCYVPDAFHQTWIESELALLRITVQIGRTIDQLIAALVSDPPPRPQLLFADLNAMTPGEVLHLHAVREHGWFGTVFAIGSASPALCASLGVERVLTPPLTRDSFRNALVGTSYTATTSRMSRISG